MAERRTGSVVAILVIVAALMAVWWIDRGRDDRVRPVDDPTSTVAPVPVAPTVAPAAPAIAPSAPNAATDPADPPIAARPLVPRAAVSPEIADIDLSWIADRDERAEVARVATAIDRGGPFGYRKDGAVFSNRERRLPSRPSGYWREYTVPTPGEDDRGARRLVAGQRREIYYTRDHYRSFTAVRGATP